MLAYQCVILSAFPKMFVLLSLYKWEIVIMIPTKKKTQTICPFNSKKPSC